MSQEDINEKTTALVGSGLTIPPPFLYLIAFFIGLGLNYLRPLSLLPRPWGLAIGIILVAASLPIMPPVLKRYKKAGTPFDVRKPTTALISDGPYQYSRNPTYLSLTFLYLGVGLLFNNGWIILLAVPLIFLMNFWIIRREERHLEEVFGQEYLQHKSKVRRWF